MRSTVAGGFRLMALFIGGETWMAPVVARELGWTKTKTHDMLSTAVAEGYLEKVELGREVRYRLSEAFKDTLRRGLARASRQDARDLIARRTAEAQRALQVQMEHLEHELAEVLA